MPPKVKKQRRRKTSRSSEQKVMMQFTTYALAGTSETAVNVAPLTWIGADNTVSIGTWSTFRVLDVVVAAVAGTNVRWRVVTSSTKPTVDYIGLVAHPDTVHALNTTTVPVTRRYVPVGTGYLFDQNWMSSGTPITFPTGLHIVWAAGTGTSTGTLVAFTATFRVRLTNWMGKAKPLTESQDSSTLGCELAEARIPTSTWSLYSRESDV